MPRTRAGRCSRRRSSSPRSRSRCVRWPGGRRCAAPVDFKAVYAASAVGSFLDTVLPARLGEASKVGVLRVSAGKRWPGFSRAARQPALRAPARGDRVSRRSALPQPHSSRSPTGRGGRWSAASRFAAGAIGLAAAPPPPPRPLPPPTRRRVPRRARPRRRACLPTPAASCSRRGSSAGSASCCCCTHSESRSGSALRSST